MLQNFSAKLVRSMSRLLRDAYYCTRPNANTLTIQLKPATKYI